MRWCAVLATVFSLSHSVSANHRMKRVPKGCFNNAAVTQQLEKAVTTADFVDVAGTFSDRFQPSDANGQSVALSASAYQTRSAASRSVQAKATAASESQAAQGKGSAVATSHFLKSKASAVAAKNQAKTTAVKTKAAKSGGTFSDRAGQMYSSNKIAKTSMINAGGFGNFFSTTTEGSSGNEKGDSTSTTSSSSTTMTNTSSTSNATSDSTSSTTSSQTGSIQGVGAQIIASSSTQAAQASVTTSISSSTSILATGTQSSGVGAAFITSSSTLAQAASALSASSSGASASLAADNTSSSAARATVEAAQASPSVFQLPGRQISVLPVGLAVIGGVSILAILVVGIVTYERRKYRNQYRLRKLAQQMANGPDRMTEVKV